MEGEFWKNQAIEDILPYWTAHAQDTVNGAFWTYLDGEWNASGDTRKYPSMVSRHLFSYAAAYLLTGNGDYMNIARKTKDFQIEKGWDMEHGGWFDELDPVLETKSMFVQVYAITGLTMYYLVTWDPENGGYFNVMNRDWTVTDSRKTL